MNEPRKPLIRKRYIIVLALVLLLNLIKLPYYYSQPGIAQELNEMITVEGTNGVEEGAFMLTTVEMARATPLYYVWSLLSSYRHILPEEQVRGSEESDSDYHERQRLLMAGSQENAKIAAYEQAGAEVSYEYRGVLVTNLIEGMPAAKELKTGDLITEVNGTPTHTAEELLELLEGYSKDDVVTLSVTRDAEPRTVELAFQPFPDEYEVEEGRVGLGILSPVTDRDVTFSPAVSINETDIGAPSAGLMYSLEIYNQLVDEDITHGYLIAGTGTINDEGTVGYVGGASQRLLRQIKRGRSTSLHLMQMDKMERIMKKRNTRQKISEQICR